MSSSSPIPASDPPRRKSLRWEITGVLLVKLSIILLAAFTIFGGSHRLRVDMDVMSNQLFGNSEQDQ